jgi:peptidoglycan-associated lipoprotein
LETRYSNHAGDTNGITETPNKEKKMKPYRMMPLALALIFPATLLMFTACASKKEISSEPYTQTEGAGADRAGEADLGREGGIGEEELAGSGMRTAAEQQRIEQERDTFENEDIYFEFDSASLNAAAREVLQKKARWLDENPSVKVIIEGHCDNRGTNEYNLALGEARARSAQAYLLDLGIHPSRIKTVSYGEERPIDPAETEEAWAKNRRAHFVILN